MIVADALGVLVGAMLIIGFGWAILDLLIKILRQPKREGPIDLCSLSPYPLVPEPVKTSELPVERGRSRSIPFE